MSQPHATDVRQPRRRAGVSLHAFGEPMVWLAGGALGVSILMIGGLLLLVFAIGLGTFWPKAVESVTLRDGTRFEAVNTGAGGYILTRQLLAGMSDDGARLRALAAAAQVPASELPSDQPAQAALLALSLVERPTEGLPSRLALGLGKRVAQLQFRRANKHIYSDGQWLWVDLHDITQRSTPTGLVYTEGRGELGRSRMIGTPTAILEDGKEAVTGEPSAIMAALAPRLMAAEARHAQQRHIEEVEIGALARAKDAALRQVRYVISRVTALDPTLGRRAGKQFDAYIATEDDLLSALTTLTAGMPGEERSAIEARFCALAARAAEPAAWESLVAQPSESLKESLTGIMQLAQRLHEQALAGLATQSRAELAAECALLDTAFGAYRQERWRSQVGLSAASARIAVLRAANGRELLRLRHAEGESTEEPLSDFVRVIPVNDLGFAGRFGVYLSRWHEFLFHDPRNANSEGGVMPAIIGTVTMTIAMTLIVVPFGVLAALYLREYAKGGPIVTAIRIAINNLAGVPSIVYGVFGLGFFILFVGVGVDWLFYPEFAAQSKPYFRTGGILWAALTLSLMTLPVVIVATEEALSAVPKSMREGSYGCGASKWQTIQRIVLPRAMPGIMTGAILAMARGAGEVAPLMIVGAVKLAPALPLDLTDWSGSLGFLPTGPVHMNRSFMHLGFHIYDVGFQSQDSEAAKPMVYTTTLLLIGIVTVLNVVAIWLRNRLRRRFVSSAF